VVTEKTYCFYIMSNVSKMWHVGVTNNLEKRVFQPQSKRIPGYTQKYDLFKLAYLESFGDIRAANHRENGIQSETLNPEWNDLAEGHSMTGTKFKRLPS
jgi:putative endonuclease